MPPSKEKKYKTWSTYGSPYMRMDGWTKGFGRKNPCGGRCRHPAGGAAAAPGCGVAGCGDAAVAVGGAGQWWCWQLVMLDVGLRWPALVVVGRCGPALAFVGLRVPSLGAVGFRGPALACVDLRWSSLGAVGLRWPSVGFRGCRPSRRGVSWVWQPASNKDLIKRPPQLAVHAMGWACSCIKLSSSSVRKTIRK